MKNIQYYLKTLDKKRLVEEYYDLVKEGIFEYKDKEISIEEFELGYKIKIAEFIEKLINMEIKQTKDQGIILAYKFYASDCLISELDVGLVYENELKEKKLDAWFYGYEFLHQSEILSFLVSDSKYTQENIYEVVANVLYEASFFGFDEKDMEEHKEKLQESIDDIKSGDYKTKKPDFLKKKKESISNNNQIIDSIYENIKERKLLNNDAIISFTESEEEKMEDKLSEVVIRTVLYANHYLAKQGIKHVINELGIE